MMIFVIDRRSPFILFLTLQLLMVLIGVKKGYGILSLLFFFSFTLLEDLLPIGAIIPFGHMPALIYYVMFLVLMFGGLDSSDTDLFIKISYGIIVGSILNVVYEIILPNLPTPFHMPQRQQEEFITNWTRARLSVFGPPQNFPGRS